MPEHVDAATEVAAAATPAPITTGALMLTLASVAIAAVAFIDHRKAPATIGNATAATFNDAPKLAVSAPAKAKLSLLTLASATLRSASAFAALCLKATEKRACLV